MMKWVHVLTKLLHHEQAYLRRGSSPTHDNNTIKLTSVVDGRFLIHVSN